MVGEGGKEGGREERVKGWRKVGEGILGGRGEGNGVGRKRRGRGMEESRAW